jgi:hypothetical protein
MRSVVPIDEQERASRGFPSHMITFGVLVSAVAGSIRGNQSLPPRFGGAPSSLRHLAGSCTLPV